jgi:hypothetical protein
MSLPLPEIKAWETNLGVGDNEQAELAADQSTAKVATRAGMLEYTSEYWQP